MKPHADKTLPCAAVPVCAFALFILALCAALSSCGARVTTDFSAKSVEVTTKTEVIRK